MGSIFSPSSIPENKYTPAGIRTAAASRPVNVDKGAPPKIPNRGGNYYVETTPIDLNININPTRNGNNGENKPKLTLKLNDDYSAELSTPFLYGKASLYGGLFPQGGSYVGGGFGVDINKSFNISARFLQSVPFMSKDEKSIGISLLAYFPGNKK